MIIIIFYLTLDFSWIFTFESYAAPLVKAFQSKELSSEDQTVIRNQHCSCTIFVFRWDILVPCWKEDVEFVNFFYTSKIPNFFYFTRGKRINGVIFGKHLEWRLFYSYISTNCLSFQTKTNTSYYVKSYNISSLN